MKNKRRNAFRCIWFVLISLVVTAAAFVVLLDIRLRPVLREYALLQVRTQTGLSVNQAIGEVLCRRQGQWLQLSYGEDGHVLAVRVDEQALGLFKTEVAQSVLSSLSDCRQLPVSVQVGSVMGGSLLTGRGPVMHFPVNTACTATVSVQNSFSSAGINQTQHIVMLTVDIDMAVTLPDGCEKQSYRQEGTVAQTVLVGQTPQVYIGRDSNETLQRILGYTDLA